MKPLNMLGKARSTLKDVAGSVPVLLRGDRDPGNQEPVIILDLVSSTPYGYDQATETDVQVSVYAPKLADALALQETASAAMQAAGFREGQTRPAVDEIGVITDWRM